MYHLKSIYSVFDFMCTCCSGSHMQENSAVTVLENIWNSHELVPLIQIARGLEC